VSAHRRCRHPRRCGCGWLRKVRQVLALVRSLIHADEKSHVRDSVSLGKKSFCWHFFNQQSFANGRVLKLFAC
jgi:hypothetical protein